MHRQQRPPPPNIGKPITYDPDSIKDLQGTFFRANQFSKLYWYNFTSEEVHIINNFHTQMRERLDLRMWQWEMGFHRQPHYFYRELREYKDFIKHITGGRLLTYDPNSIEDLQSTFFRTPEARYLQRYNFTPMEIYLIRNFHKRMREKLGLTEAQWETGFYGHPHYFYRELRDYTILIESMKERRLKIANDRATAGLIEKQWKNTIATMPPEFHTHNFIRRFLRQTRKRITKSKRKRRVSRRG